MPSIIQTAVRMRAMSSRELDHGPLAFSPGILRALSIVAEPNRARIVELLGHGVHCVCDVGEALQLSPALASHHLRVLYEGGLLREQRNGRWVFYALDLDRLAELRAAVDSLLTPTNTAATACLRSDCGSMNPPTLDPGDLLRSRPLLTEVVS